MSHDRCSHGPGVAKSNLFFRLFSRCQTCDRFRVWAWYYKVWAMSGDWWWACKDCKEGDSNNG